MSSNIDNFHISKNGSKSGKKYNYHFKIVPVDDPYELKNVTPVECVKFIDINTNKPRIFKIQVRNDDLRLYKTELDDQSIGCPYKKNYGTVDNPIWGCTYEHRTLKDDDGNAKPSAEENSEELVNNLLDHLDPDEIENQKTNLKNQKDGYENLLESAQADLESIISWLDENRESEDVSAEEIIEKENDKKALERKIEILQQKINRATQELENFYVNQGYYADRLADAKNEADYPLSGGAKNLEERINEINKYWGCPKYKPVDKPDLKEKFKYFLSLFKSTGDYKFKNENDLPPDIDPEHADPAMRYNDGNNPKYDDFIAGIKKQRADQYIAYFEQCKKLINILTRINFSIAENEYFVKYAVPEERDFYEYGEDGESFEPVCSYTFSNLAAHPVNVFPAKIEEGFIQPINSGLKQDDLYTLKKSENLLAYKKTNNSNGEAKLTSFTATVKKYRPIVMPIASDLFSMVKPDEKNNEVNVPVPNSSWNIIPYKQTSMPEYQGGRIMIPTSFDIGNDINSDNFLNIDFDFYKKVYLQNVNGELLNVKTGIIESAENKENAYFGPLITNDLTYSKFKYLKNLTWILYANSLITRNPYGFLKNSSYNLNKIFPGFIYDGCFSQTIAGKSAKGLSAEENKILDNIFKGSNKAAFKEFNDSLVNAENAGKSTWFYSVQAPEQKKGEEIPNEITGLMPWVFGASMGGYAKNQYQDKMGTSDGAAVYFGGGSKSSSGSGVCATVNLDLAKIFPNGTIRKTLTLNFHSWINEVSHTHYSDLYCNLSTGDSFMICRYNNGPSAGNLSSFGDGSGTSNHTYDSRYHDRTWVNCKWTISGDKLNNLGNTLTLSYIFNWSNNGKGGGREGYVAVDTEASWQISGGFENIYLAYGQVDESKLTLKGLSKITRYKTSNDLACVRSGEQIMEISSYGNQYHPYQASWHPILKFGGYDLKDKFKSLDKSSIAYRGFVDDRYTATKTEWKPTKSTTEFEKHTGTSDPFSYAENKAPVADWQKYSQNEYWRNSPQKNPQPWYLWSIVKQQIFLNNKSIEPPTDDQVFLTMNDLYQSYLQHCQADPENMTSTFIKVLSAGSKFNGNGYSGEAWNMLLYTGHDLNEGISELNDSMCKQTFVINRVSGTININGVQNKSNILREQLYADVEDFKKLNLNLPSVSMPDNTTKNLSSCYGNNIPQKIYFNSSEDQKIYGIKTNSVIIPVFPNWDVLKKSNGEWNMEPTIEDFKKIFFQVVPISVYKPYMFTNSNSNGDTTFGMTESRFFTWKIASFYIMTSVVSSDNSTDNSFKGSPEAMNSTSLPENPNGFIQWK